MILVDNILLSLLISTIKFTFMNILFTKRLFLVILYFYMIGCSNIVIKNSKKFQKIEQNENINDNNNKTTCFCKCPNFKNLFCFICNLNKKKKENNKNKNNLLSEIASINHKNSDSIFSPSNDNIQNKEEKSSENQILTIEDYFNYIRKFKKEKAKFDIYMIGCSNIVIKNSKKFQKIEQNENINDNNNKTTCFCKCPNFKNLFCFICNLNKKKKENNKNKNNLLSEIASINHKNSDSIFSPSNDNIQNKEEKSSENQILTIEDYFNYIRKFKKEKAKFDNLINEIEQFFENEKNESVHKFNLKIKISRNQYESFEEYEQNKLKLSLNYTKKTVYRIY